MKRLIIALAIAAAFPAFAQDSTSSGTASSNSSSNPVVSNGSSTSNSGANVNGVTSSANPNNANAQNVIFNTSSGGSSTMDATSRSTSTSDSTNRVIQSGTTTSNIVNSGESTQNVHYSGTQTLKNVPGIQMSGPASGPCTGASGGVGVAGPGFGVGLNGAKVDDGCTVRENTRVLGQLYQSLASDNPAKADAQAALFEGMQILRNMNAKIGGDYRQPAPQPVAVVQPAPVAANGEPSDPYVRSRMGLPAR